MMLHRRDHMTFPPAPVKFRRLYSSSIFPAYQARFMCPVVNVGTLFSYISYVRDLTHTYTHTEPEKNECPYKSVVAKMN